MSNDCQTVPRLLTALEKTTDDKVTNEEVERVLELYLRYLDDVHGIVQADSVQEVINCIIIIGIMFPRTIPIEANKEENCEERLAQVYGATTKMEKLENTHGEVRNVIKKSLGESRVWLPTLVPGTGVQQLLYSGQSYLGKLG